MTEEPKQSFFRGWRLAILIGVPVIVVMVAVREFINYQANAPIADLYLAAINEMSLASPRARQRLEQYYAKHQRQTVASKHYPWLCHELRKLAGQDGMTRSLACPA